MHNLWLIVNTNDDQYKIVCQFSSFESIIDNIQLEKMSPLINLDASTFSHLFQCIVELDQQQINALMPCKQITQS